jgi:hypothetical protein
MATPHVIQPWDAKALAAANPLWPYSTVAVTGPHFLFHLAGIVPHRAAEGMTGARSEATFTAILHHFYGAFMTRNSAPIYTPRRRPWTAAAPATEEASESYRTGEVHREWAKE